MHLKTEEIADTGKTTLLFVSRHTLKPSSFLTSLNLRPAFILYFISFHTTPFSSLIALILHFSLSLSFTSLSLHLVLLYVSRIGFYSLTSFHPSLYLNYYPGYSSHLLSCIPGFLYSLLIPHWYSIPHPF
jgi:hypothetical protein